MKIVAVLSWFDESPTMLAACVTSLRHLEVSHLVAVDGAYGLMPGGRGTSGVDQTRVVTDVCAAAGMGLTLHQPARSFRGNEVEKRNLSLQLALQTAAPGDWLLIIDADEVLEPVRGAALRMLAETDLDAATCSLVRKLDPQAGTEDEFVARCSGGPDSVNPVRRLLRALPGLRYQANHYTVVDGDRVLTPDSYFAERALDLGASVFIEHRKHLRDIYRLERGAAFYSARDSACIEKVYEGANT